MQAQLNLDNPVRGSSVRPQYSCKINYLEHLNFRVLISWLTHLGFIDFNCSGKKQPTVIFHSGTKKEKRWGACMPFSSLFSTAPIWQHIAAFIIPKANGEYKIILDNSTGHVQENRVGSCLLILCNVTEARNVLYWSRIFVPLRYVQNINSYCHSSCRRTPWRLRN